MSVLGGIRSFVETVRSTIARESEGGQPDSAFERGDVVADRETEDKELLVMGTKNERADEYVIPGTTETVAEYNPEYPPTDGVVEVRFFETLDAHLGEWTIENVLDREASGELAAGDPYYYPESRLDPISERVEAAASSN